ncbi:hypothetical protein METBIDRAFT_79619 [Metschnikowia bicuspidata var. bicuspidata NRRL YB-4993]|uniref:Uncharacterized protein n=1 Tax=Metschnikowia bicuspidata var. bicuspidata NRRL YB-4993 TaxID=869754 RepID=A0A1A0H6F3_9ASCO|nr:hypothetical protein METBIDRAFT_79619 [Metschnikowia bicuspidata var. bicuspidata NRRL YB-4993]OBA19611.1 hypothetical protein METBIDRAFT_79619 [Metschnikowia bicuspidata var. bicuspidata NRRL YB-4993]
MAHYQQVANRFLHEVQKSPEGYDVALYLLSQDSLTCKYFGALTLTVVLQHPGLDVAQCQRVVSTLLTHIGVLTVDAQTTDRNLFVVRKLMSNISLAYLKYHQTFNNPIISFVQIFVPDVPDHAGVLEFATLMANFSFTQLALLLIFLSILVEDVSKSNDFRSAIHTAVRENLYPLFLTVYQYLAYIESQNQLLQELDSQALQTLHSWMVYLPNVNGDSLYEDIGVLVDFLSLHFKDGISGQDQDILESIKQTLIIFNEVLELNANMLSHEQKQALYATVLGTWGTQLVDTVILNVEDDFHEESAAYIDLFLTILQLNSIRLSKSILVSNTQAILALALRLTAVEGTPIIDELISERMLLFWEDFASVYEDSSDVFDTFFETQEDPQFQTKFEAEKRRIFDTVARIYWRKLRLPEPTIYGQIRAEFNAYRSSVADFFLVVYSLLKAEFYQLMSEFLIEGSLHLSTSTEKLLDVEATMYILFKINDDTVYFESQANQLAPFSQAIFETGFLTKFATFENGDSMYTTVLATLVQFCSSNVFYYKTSSGSKHLSEVFNIIFPLLLNSKNTTLALLASKTALRICEESSDHLVDFLPDLENVVVGMLKNPEMDSLIRLRMFNAYSVIARSIQNVDEHSKILHGMVSAIASAASSVIESISGSLENILEAQEEYLSSLLSCLVNIAKGSSISDDAIDEMLVRDQETYRDFWSRDPYMIKQTVFSIVHEFSLTNSALAQKPIFVEKCTLILKAGIGERLGSGFDVGNEAIMTYALALMEVTTNANTVPFIFGLVECLVSVEYQHLDPAMMQQLVQRIFTNKLAFLKSDPDMIKSAIDLFSKVLECKPSLILYTEIFRCTILQFAVEGLAANELFVVKSILRFWTSFLGMRRGTGEDHAECQRIFTELNLVEVVTSELIASFVKSARSNLEYYYSVFRSLIAKFPMQFKTSLATAIDEATLVQKIGTKELELFVHKLMVTRGRRTANEVLKLFWLAANGFVEYNHQRI